MAGPWLQVVGAFGYVPTAGWLLEARRWARSLCASHVGVGVGVVTCNVLLVGVGRGPSPVRLPLFTVQSVGRNLYEQKQLILEMYTCVYTYINLPTLPLTGGSGSVVTNRLAA